MLVPVRRWLCRRTSIRLLGDSDLQLTDGGSAGGQPAGGPGNGGVTVGDHLGSSGRGTTAAAGDSTIRLWSIPIIEREVPLTRCYVALSLVLLNVCDVLLTKAVLHRGGVEANPIMQELMAGLAAPIGVKAAAAALAGLLLLMCPAESRLADRAAVAVAGLYFAVVVWNTALLGWLVVNGM